MFKKILIANRGEIACRIMLSCRQLNIKTVAVYSTADRDAQFVHMADEAYCVGPSASADSYLNREGILMAGIIAHVDAVHPGYGFLAEDALFAQMCAQCGITWLGPKPDLISLMGDKAAARKFAASRGIAIIPGTFVLDDMDQVERAARKIGYPLLIKASQGGGGKGIRIVKHPDDLASQLTIAKQETNSAFGSTAIYLERVLQNARHIEVQVIGDADGRILVLGDRDCTLQLRRQKVIEESPASFITEAQRRELTVAVHRLLDGVGYQGLGTVEFLFSEDRFYFLEMNTRLQVEHGVTETTTGLDIVMLQLQLATREAKLGHQVPTSQGVALECRLNLTGVVAGNQLQQFDFPVTARVDTGYQAGDRVPTYYDALLAKIIVSAPTHQLAVLKMQATLAQVHVAGVETNLPLLRQIVATNWFMQGQFSVQTLDERLKHDKSFTS
jgi:acetyl-CoA carboxylase biotin carboxylase subunit